MRAGRRAAMLVAGLLAAGVALAAEAGSSGGHADPVTPILFQLSLILAAAKLGGALFLRYGQPAVLGELVAGVLLGNLLLPFGLDADAAAGRPGPAGWYAAFLHDSLTAGTPIDVLARLGVILLLFIVGLESNVGDMLRVGATSLAVATVGVVAPFVLGWAVSRALLPGGPHHPLVHVYIGACLTATSVGITARVLRELGRLERDEARIILGAAVLDDVMGLVILAVVGGMVVAEGTGEPLHGLAIAKIIVLAVGFLAGAVWLGRRLAPRLFGFASRLHGGGLLMLTALLLCFVLAATANLLGLAPIVGAFAAGLLLDELHFESFRDRGVQHRVDELLEPIAHVLVPIFFVQMGMTVRLETFGAAGVLFFAAVLTGAAIAGKQVCGLVVPKGLDRLSIGVGMVPRGEVGLIFAAIGAGLTIGGERVIDDVSNAAVVIMVIVTTMVTPPLLQATLRRGDAARAPRKADDEPTATGDAT